MSKFDEAIKRLGNIEWLLDKMSDWLGMNIRERDSEYGTDEHLFKIHKTLELGKLYKELSNYVDEQTNAHELPEITTLKIKIKELENE